MQLTIFNGSPRGKKGNTRFIINAFINGFKNNNKTDYKINVIDLNKTTDNKMLLKNFNDADHVILAFPLYIDSMPGIVKQFIEILQKYKPLKKTKHLGFIVQSGFPEKKHSSFIEKYLIKLCSRLKCSYQGTVIKGGVEIIRINQMLNNSFFKLLYKTGSVTNIGGVGQLLDEQLLYKNFFTLGEIYQKTNTFDKKLIKKLSHPKRLNQFGFFLFQFVGEFLYWRYQLKRNKALKERDRQPYIY